MKIVIDADPGADLVASDGQITVIGYKSVQILPDTHAPAAPEEPERKPPQRLVIPKPYKDIDVGKARALRAAGWSFERIADELGVSPTTVANRLRQSDNTKEETNT